MSDEQSPHERWVELRAMLDRFVEKRNWLQFEKALPLLHSIAKHGQYSNLMTAIFDQEEDIS